MNAITANATHASARSDNAARPNHRRRAIFATVAATLLGLYVLGVSWFANELGSEMQRSLQVAPAVQDVEHRG